MSWRCGLSEKPSLLTPSPVPPPIPCCLWMPSPSPRMHLNLCSPGPAPHTAWSPNFVPLPGQNLHHFFHFCSFFFFFFHFQLKSWGWLPTFRRQFISSCYQFFSLVSPFVNSKMPKTGKKMIIPPSLCSPNCLAITYCRTEQGAVPVKRGRSSSVGSVSASKMPPAPHPSSMQCEQNAETHTWDTKL